MIRVYIRIIKFAWLTIIELITFPIVFIIGMIAMHREISTSTQNDNQALFITIYVIAGIIVTIVSVRIDSFVY